MYLSKKVSKFFNFIIENDFDEKLSIFKKMILF